MLFIKNNWLLLLILSMIALFFIYDSINQRNNDAEFKKEQEIVTTIATNENVEEIEVTKEKQLMYIDIKGEVESPGVYQVEADKRVSDLIDLAGGFTENANVEYVNLAQKVFDEMVILVPIQGEEINEQGVSDQPSDSKVRINYATMEELLTLPGIGSVKAEAIIQYREQYGHFKVVEDLVQVTGIGDKTLEKIKGEILVP
ncbi:helix-hairpin-helix domain-containing protein [Aquibacillus saliphilus]|uniref:helix-hairpin-helix domain-containing protein n=1 Tax=Aquibacillus saliphilus TaxID=1909422 RepID=UPI001CF0871A|nr:helix-hairpin-helix domain-containing protein [Aquibacillus saliphilus]